MKKEFRRSIVPSQYQFVSLGRRKIKSQISFCLLFSLMRKYFGVHKLRGMIHKSALFTWQIFLFLLSFHSMHPLTHRLQCAYSRLMIVFYSELLPHYKIEWKDQHSNECYDSERYLNHKKRNRSFFCLCLSFDLKFLVNTNTINNRNGYLHLESPFFLFNIWMQLLIFVRFCIYCSYSKYPCSISKETWFHRNPFKSMVSLKRKVDFIS